MAKESLICLIAAMYVFPSTSTESIQIKGVFETLNIFLDVS